VGEPLALAVGVVLVAVGAVGATVTQRRLEDDGRATTAPLWLVPFGVLVGAGAAVARGWDLAASMAVGAVLIPLVGVVGRYLEVRRHRRRRRHERDG
jgi:ABC-type spermidine/putrescine transport system permease subunit I